MTIYCRTWWDRSSEPAFVMRSLAATLQRRASVQVVTPGPPGKWADGSFDVRSIGEPREPGEPGGPAKWPDAAEAWDDRIDLAQRVEGRCLAVVEATDRAALAIAGSDPQDAMVLMLGGTEHVGELPESVWARAPGASDPIEHRQFDGRRTVHVDELDVFVPVNPLAAAKPHNGFGFTDYVLVLSDRPAAAPGERPLAQPSPATTTVIQGSAHPHTVVVEDATAAAWLDHSLRGAIPIDTRTDLWRLLAHARVTVDLAPGTYLARECVESLRFGTPLVVPAGSAAARLTAAGGGLSFADAAELLGAVEKMANPNARKAFALQGSAHTEAHHGDAGRFTAAASRVLQA